MNLNRKKEQGENLQVNDTFYTKIIKENLNLKFSFDVFFSFGSKNLSIFNFYLTPHKTGEIFSAGEKWESAF